MLNQCNFIGRLGADPETRFFPDGTMVAQFRIVTEKKYVKDGEKVVRAEWIRIVTFKKLAEICANYLKKGSLVWISGSMQTRKWTDKEGVERFTTEIVGREMLMLGPKKQQEEREPGYEGDPAFGDSEDDDVPF